VFVGFFLKEKKKKGKRRCVSITEGKWGN